MQGHVLGGARLAPINTSFSFGGSCTVTSKYILDGKCGVIYFCYCWSKVMLAGTALLSYGALLGTHRTLSKICHKANISMTCSGGSTGPPLPNTATPQQEPMWRVT